MKINNTIIQGIFIYDSGLNYTEGDFVIYKRSIYIYSPSDSNSELSKLPPPENPNFQIYLGDMMSDINDYFSLEKEGESTNGTNKYISIKYLPAILNSYMMGFSGKGIIGNNIKYPIEDINNLSENNGRITVLYKSEDEINTRYTNFNTILSDILIDPEVNNAIYRVSRELPEIYPIMGLDKATEYEGLDIDKKSCILKQYTYTNEDSDETLTRVQELIDHLDGQIYYRSATIMKDGSIKSMANSEFKLATINTESLRNKANHLFNVYSSKIKSLNQLGEDLKSNFRYRKVNLSSREDSIITIQNKDITGDNWIRCNDLKDVGSITVEVLSLSDGELFGISQSNQFTFDPLDILDEGKLVGNKIYLISDLYQANIDVKLNSDDSSKGEIRIVVNSRANSIFVGVRIISIYYQEFYN